MEVTGYNTHADLIIHARFNNKCMRCMLKMLVLTLLLASVPRASYSQPGSDTKVCQAHFWNKSQNSLKSHQPQDQNNWWTSLIQISSTYIILHKVEPECSTFITNLLIYDGGGIRQWCGDITTLIQ